VHIVKHITIAVQACFSFRMPSFSSLLHYLRLQKMLLVVLFWGAEKDGCCMPMLMGRLESVAAA
jgi:hypothetical protein